MVPGFGVTEGGQSAGGAAIDHPGRSHPAYNEAAATAHAGGMELLEFLERRIVARSQNPDEAAWFARDIHVLPEFLGNRSPFADPDSPAVVNGMDLDAHIRSRGPRFGTGRVPPPVSRCPVARGLA